MSDWQDTSSYSQTLGRRRGVMTHRSWEKQYPSGLRIAVHRLHGIQNQWFLSTYNPELFKQKSLKSTDIKEAQSEAMSLIKRKLKSLWNEMEKSEQD